MNDTNAANDNGRSGGAGAIHAASLSDTSRPPRRSSESTLSPPEVWKRSVLERLGGDWWQWLVCAAFLGLSLLVASRHEPWRDEAQAWLIARDAGGWAQIIQRLGYEGSPGLWHMLLYPLTRLGLPYFSMQVLHCFLASIAVLLIVRKAPFPWFVKLILPFGYHIFYLYGIVARSYVLVGVLLFALAAMENSRFQRPRVYAVLLALLANTCVHGAVFAIVISAGFFIALAGRLGTRIGSELLVPGAIVAAGFLAAVMQVWPPADLGFYAGWNLNIGMATLEIARNAVASAFCPELPIGPAWSVVLSTALFGLTTVALLSQPAAAARWAAGVLLLWALFQVKHGGHKWHYGLVYLYFLHCVWVAMSEAPSDRVPERSVGRESWLAWTVGAWRQSPLIVAFVAAIVQLVGGWLMVKADYLHPYSGGKEAAAFLRAYAVDRGPTLFATYKSARCSSLLPYLSDVAPRFYALETGEYYSFMRWDKKWADNDNVEGSLQDVVRDMFDEARRGGYERLVFIVPQLVDDPSFLRLFRLVTVIPKGALIVFDERFFIYEFSPPSEGVEP